MKAKLEKENNKAASGGGKGKISFEPEDIDPSKYTENRKNIVQDIRNKGGNPYPHKFSRTHRVDHFREEYDSLCKENNVFFEDKLVSLTGRIYSIRASGKNLIFIDLDGDSVKL